MGITGRRQQRDALKRHRELERQRKEQEKLSLIEQARLEVSLFENQIELLLSVHREQGPVWDWDAIASTFPPPEPVRLHSHEYRQRQLLCLANPEQLETGEAQLAQARTLDQHDYDSALREYREEHSQLQTLQQLASRILKGDPKAYTEALVQLSPLSELSALGSNIHFTVHETKLVECVLKVNGTSAIPSEVKSLTAAGKLSVRSMAKLRFHELYEDYICGCILRVAREVFALLPVEATLVTAVAECPNPATGVPIEQPVMSVAFTRSTLDLDFAHLDPSDTLYTLPHRGNFKSSRKTGVFQPVVPISPADLAQESTECSDTDTLLKRIKHLREQLQTDLAALCPANRAEAAET